jgi:hypothetical protein
VDVLEEVKYYNRIAGIMGMEDLYLPDLPLDRVVDASRPESMEARDFNKLVDAYIADPLVGKEEITRQLEIWSANNEKLEPFIHDSEKLMDIEHISANFSFIAQSALDKLNAGKMLSEEENNEVMEKLTFLEQGENGVLLAVVPGLRKLILK